MDEKAAQESTELERLVDAAGTWFGWPNLTAPTAEGTIARMPTVPATRLRPLRDHVIVKPLEDQRTGVIEVVRVVGAKWRRGIVLAVGPGRPGSDGVPQPWGTAVGDVVQFTDVMTYPEFEDVSGRVLVIQEADVCAVEEPGDRAPLRPVWQDPGLAKAFAAEFERPFPATPEAA